MKKNKLCAINSEHLRNNYGGGIRAAAKNWLTKIPCIIK
jgi:hypothetical protein